MESCSRADFVTSLKKITGFGKARKHPVNETDRGKLLDEGAVGRFDDIHGLCRAWKCLSCTTKKADNCSRYPGHFLQLSNFQSDNH